MFHAKNTRLERAALADVAFFADLPTLLGCSKSYAQHLCRPPKGERGDWYREARFPAPVWVSEGGIRVWLVRDLENWLLSSRVYATRKRLRGAALLHRPEIADRVLGRT